MGESPAPSAAPTELHGIGPSTASKLEDRGVSTVKDVYEAFQAGKDSVIELVQQPYRTPVMMEASEAVGKPLSRSDAERIHSERSPHARRIDEAIDAETKAGSAGEWAENPAGGDLPGLDGSADTDGDGDVDKSDAEAIHSDRSEHAQDVDDARDATPADSVGDWAEDPSQTDLDGVDTPAAETGSLTLDHVVTFPDTGLDVPDGWTLVNEVYDPSYSTLYRVQFQHDETGKWVEAWSNDVKATPTRFRQHDEIPEDPASEYGEPSTLEISGQRTFHDVEEAYKALIGWMEEYDADTTDNSADSGEDDETEYGDYDGVDDDSVDDVLFVDFEDVQPKPDPDDYGIVTFSKSGYEFEVEADPLSDLVIRHGDTTRRVRGIEGDTIHFVQSMRVGGQSVDGVEVPDSGVIDDVRDIKSEYQDALGSWKDDRAEYYEDLALAFEVETIEYRPSSVGYGSGLREETILSANKPEAYLTEDEEVLYEALEERGTVKDKGIDAPEELSEGDRRLAKPLVEEFASDEYEAVKSALEEQKRQEQIADRYPVVDSSSRRQKYEGDDYWTFKEFEIRDEETGETYEVTVKVDHVGNVAVVEGQDAPDVVKERAKNLAQPASI